MIIKRSPRPKATVLGQPFFTPRTAPVPEPEPPAGPRDTFDSFADLHGVCETCRRDLVVNMAAAAANRTPGPVTVTSDVLRAFQNGAQGVLDLMPQGRDRERAAEAARREVRTLGLQAEEVHGRITRKTQAERLGKLINDQVARVHISPGTLGAARQAVGELINASSFTNSEKSRIAAKTFDRLNRAAAGLNPADPMVATATRDQAPAAAANDGTTVTTQRPVAVEEDAPPVPRQAEAPPQGPAADLARLTGDEGPDDPDDFERELEGALARFFTISLGLSGDDVRKQAAAAGLDPQAAAAVHAVLTATTENKQEAARLVAQTFKDRPGLRNFLDDQLDRLIAGGSEAGVREAVLARMSDSLGFTLADPIVDPRVPEEPRQAEEPSTQTAALDEAPAPSPVLGEFGRLPEAEARAEAEANLKDAIDRLESWQKAIAVLNRRIDATNDAGLRDLRGVYVRVAQRALRDAIRASDQLAGRSELPRFTKLRNAIDASIDSFLSLGPDALKAAGIVGSLLPGIRQDNALVTAADDLERSIKALFPGDPARAEEFLTALAQGSGSLASLLLGGVAIRGAATLLAKSGKVASRVGIAVVGSTSQAVEGFEEAERMGADALARYTAFFLNAGLGATEAIPIDRFFSRLNRVTDNRVAKLLQTTSAQSLEEFTQEVIESLGSDVIAKAVFDPEREIDVRGALKQGVVGAITGGPLGVVAGLKGETARPSAENPEHPTATVDSETGMIPQLDDFKVKFDAGTPVDELLDHPALRQAVEQADAIPLTSNAAGFGTENWRRSRRFNFDGEEVVGYRNAEEKLIKRARALGWTDDGLSLPAGAIKRDKQAFIMLGAPAAGKSSIANPLARAKGAAIVDSDDVKKALPEFNDGLGTTAVHRESSDIATRVLEVVSNDGTNIVIPRVGSNRNAIAPCIEVLRRKGYQVFVVLVDVPPDQAFRRMLGRFSTTGRLINPTYARNIGNGPNRTYNELKQKGDLDGFATIDNSRRPQDPKPVREDTNGILTGIDF